jgi:diacylglycerol O-acyltransferase
MDRMNPLDASFLHLENEVTQLHIASISIFEGPPPDYADLCRRYQAKVQLVPRYLQKVRFVPWNLGRPVWVDDPGFDITYHVRRTALPAPGDDDALRALVGRLMSQPLDRRRPLWETWVIEGLEGGRFGLLSKVHHAVVDGVAGADLLAFVLDVEREPSPFDVPEFEPEPEPTGGQLAARAVVDLATRPYEQLRRLRALARTPRRAASHVLDLARGYARLGGLLVPTPSTSLNGPVGPHRRWTWARASLADVKEIRNAFGGTVNDVVVAAITRGFRELLLSRQEPVDGRVLRTLVPVSIRAEDEHGVWDNRVTGMFAELPVGIDDPVACLAAIHDQLLDLKQSHESEAVFAIETLGDMTPPAMLAATERFVARLRQRNVNTVTTNVPGPQFPLYLCGREMLEVFPYVPLALGVRIGVAIFSYVGALNFGVTGDYDTTGDLDVLAHGIERAMGELVARTGVSA